MSIYVSLAGRGWDCNIPPVKLILFLLAISLLVNEVLQTKKKKMCVSDGVLAPLPPGTASNIHKVAHLTKA